MDYRTQVFFFVSYIICLVLVGFLKPEDYSIYSFALLPILYAGSSKNMSNISVLNDNVKSEVLRIRFIQENFKEQVEIEFNIDVKSKVRLSVYDMYGKLVKILLNDEFKEGKHYLIWKRGHALTDGPHYFKMESGDMVEVKKLFYSKEN